MSLKQPPIDAHRQELEKLIHEVMEGKELSLDVDSYQMDDDLKTGRVAIRCNVHDEHSGETSVIEGKGVGILDAFFHGLVEKFSKQYPSLATLRFAAFTVQGDLDSGRDSARSDSEAFVTLTVANSRGAEFSFQDRSPSITRSSMRTVLAATQFFLNAERAFLEVSKALKHAQETRRSDSVSMYTRQLTMLVEAASYSEAIEKAKS